MALGMALSPDLEGLIFQIRQALPPEWFMPTRWQELEGNFLYPTEAEAMVALVDERIRLLEMLPEGLTCRKCWGKGRLSMDDPQTAPNITLDDAGFFMTSGMRSVTCWMCRGKGREKPFTVR